MLSNIRWFTGRMAAGGSAGCRVPSSHLIPCNLLCPQDIQHTEKFLIKPESRVAQLNTSQWPLLLKVERLQAPWGPSPAPLSLSAGPWRLQLLLCVTAAKKPCVTLRAGAKPLHAEILL